MSSTSQRPPRSWLEKPLLLAAIALLAIPLLLYAYEGTFARYVADDYCYAGLLHDAGFVEYERVLLEGNTGRFTAIFFFWFFSLLGIRWIQILPTLALVLQLAAFTLVLRTLLLPLRLRHTTWIAFLVAELILFTRLRMTIVHDVSIGQALFWQVGLINANLPFTLTGVYAAVLANAVSGSSQITGRRTRALAAVSFVITFLAGGLYETFAAALIVVLVWLAVIVCLFMPHGTQRKLVLILIVAGALGSVLSVGVMMLAPSTWSRHDYIAEQAALPLPAVLRDLSIASALMIPAWLGEAPMVGVLCLLLPALISAAFSDSETLTRLAAHQARWFLRLLPLGMVAVVVASLAPSYFAASQLPPARAMTIPIAFLVMGTIWWGIVLGVEIRRAAEQSATSLKTSIAPIAVAIGTFLLLALVIGSELQQSTDRIAQVRRFAREWEDQHSEILAASASGNLNPVVRSVENPWVLDFLRPDPYFWVNGCMANYYQIETLRAE